MTARSELFGRLLKAGISSIAYCEGKTAPAIEADLGDQAGIAGYTIQRYKSGHLPPETRTVQILADACVRRGHLNREWLQSFLHAARYPTPDQLIDQLCPATPPPHPARVYANLPAPTYSQFVMRTDAYSQLADGLRQRGPVLLMASMGGMGKTSLAREVAVRCLAHEADLPPFDAVVWVSDKDRPGVTNLTIVLNEIARTLDYPGILQFAFTEKRFEIEQLLRRQRVLLVVDNFETITDEALSEWLLRIPEPSKVIITTRAHHRAFRSSWLIDLDGMTVDEARALIHERLRVLKLERSVGDIAQLDPLIAATGGNPKAIELALGLIKFERRGLPQVLDDLRAARGALFTDLFAHAWALLDDPARCVLLSLTLFSSSASRAALSATADVHGLAFDQATERLLDLALLDAQQAQLDHPPRYALHPLVYAFARDKLAQQPALEEQAREHWLAWCRELAAQVGFRWDDLRRLDLLDPDHETIQAAIHWAFQQERYAETIELIEGVRYYYNVRGLWDERVTINLLRADAARHIGDRANEALGLAHHVEIRSKQGRLDEAEIYHRQMEMIARTPNLPDDVVFEIEHARAQYARAQGDLPAAEQIWRALLALSSRLGGQKYIVNRRWLATCRYQQGDLEQAQQLYQDSLQDAIAVGDQRSVTGNRLKLVAIALDQDQTNGLEAVLDTCRTTAEHIQDRRRLGEVYQLYARLHQLRSNVPAARAALLTAIELCERGGMRRQMAECQATLAQLDALTSDA